MKHNIDTLACGINSSVCLTAGELYIIGKIANIDISEFDENNELSITLKIKDITKLLNGNDKIVDYRRTSGESLVQLLKKTVNMITEDNRTEEKHNLKLIKNNDKTIS